MILKALANQPLPIYGTGLNVRDWLYVGDNCTGIDVIYSRGTPGEIYNIGAGNERTNIDIAKISLSVLHKPENPITRIQDRAGHDFRYSISTEKIRNLGWAPSHSFDEAMSRTVEWYVQNEQWWKPLL